MSWPDRPIIFYDSTCGFCNRSVRFLLRRGSARHFYFAPLHGRTFQELVDPATASRLPDSLILWHGGKLLSQSKAIAAIARRLPWPWKGGVVVALIPACLGDRLYNYIAKRRQRIMGDNDYCMKPTREEQTIFLP